MNELQTYWERFYAGQLGGSVPLGPSDFARWVGAQLHVERPIVEFGFGNARDSFWFARRRHQVLGYDFAASAVTQAQRRAEQEPLEAQFNQLDLYDRSACEEIAGKLLASVPQPAIYGRFLIHSLETAGRHNFFDLAATALAEGGELFLEFRTGLDRGQEHVFGDDHFRTYLDSSDVATELMQRGAAITQSESGHGLAVYKTEDPHVCRFVACFGRTGA